MVLYVVDLLYLLITLAEVFFVAFVDSHGQLVTQSSRIFKKFRANPFHVIYRIAMLMPVYLFAPDILIIRCISLFEISKVKYFIRKFFRKLFDCTSSGMKASILESFLTTLLADILTLACIIHIFSSLWISVNDYKMATTADTFNSFVQATYFLFATAGTVGYGDVTLDNKSSKQVVWRYFFATMVIFFALIFFSYLQSLINALRSKLTFAQLKLQEDVSGANPVQRLRDLAYLP